jgi:hypothetical protein
LASLAKGVDVVEAEDAALDHGTALRRVGVEQGIVEAERLLSPPAERLTVADFNGAEGGACAWYLPPTAPSRRTSHARSAPVTSSVPPLVDPGRSFATPEVFFCGIRVMFFCTPSVRRHLVKENALVLVHGY